MKENNIQRLGRHRVGRWWSTGRGGVSPLTVYQYNPSSGLLVPMLNSEPNYILCSTVNVPITGVDY